MINLRLYRASLLLAPIAIVIAMFSLQSVPGERTSTAAPESFDGTAATAVARHLAPSSTPGNAADQALAKQVIQRFSQIGGAEVSVQKFGDGLENVICVLPGSSDQQLALLAGRAASHPPGVATADASTAALLGVAAGFGGSTHTKTLVFVSTDGAGDGAEGARRFASGYSNIDRVEAAIVLSQPAAARPSQPLLVPWSSGPQSTSIQLSKTTARAIENETKIAPAQASGFAELTRLALPSGLGQQAPLIESGIDAVRISSSGELPPAPSQDGLKDISAASISEFSRAALATILALDASPGPLEHGPSAYIHLAGNLLPGWALSLIAMALILPLVLVAIEAMARVGRRPQRLIRAAAWVAGRALPFLAALLLAYFLALVGVIPSPAFPYDPSQVGIGTVAKIALLLIAALLVAGLYRVRPLRPPPAPAARAAPAVCVSLIALAMLGVWISNPYLALLVAPAPHAWLLLTAEETAVGSLLATGLTIVGLLPLLAAIAALAGRFGVGLGVIWQLLVMLGDGQLGFALAALGCLLAGSGLAALALARSRIVRPPPEIEVRGAVPELTLKRVEPEI